jgi:maltooligosyltrehalose trehalohydrolase
VPDENLAIEWRLGVVNQEFLRRLPIGAELQSQGGVHFRVWAPKARTVSVVIEEVSKRQTTESETRLSAEPAMPGVFSGFVKDVAALSTYRFRLDDGASLYPDPASRFQPQGPHGPSQIVDPTSFSWDDSEWCGSCPETQILYELHIGTFTPEGTWSAATRELPRLAELGVTLLEVMPVADFTGQFGWGYDGVNLFAPTRLYGSPDDLRAFVNRAHSLNLGVILDVVYNHVGPDGNYLPAFADDYFTDRHENDWGAAINFDGPRSEHVREYFLANARYWIEEFHFDGLRLDATQAIFDTSSIHILTEIVQTVRKAANGRATVLVAENEPQQTGLVRPASEGGNGIDLLWNDDYHHSAMTVLSGHNEAYFTDYLGSPQEFISAAKWGYLYQGQRYKWQKKPRGAPSFGLNPHSFINFLQNHDQVANSARGLRCHALASPGLFRAMTALTLLMPGTPMLFQGQEFAASTPFLYFADHPADLQQKVLEGRAEFLRQFPSIALPQMQARLKDPGDPQTFEQSKLRLEERELHAETYAMHRDLIRLRRNDPVLRSPKRGQYDGAVIGPDAFLLRYLGGAENDRLLIVNLGRDLRLDVVPEPLLAPPAGMSWQMEWSSEDPRYGGMGMVPPESEEGWKLTGASTVLLVARPPFPPASNKSGVPVTERE